MPNGYAEDGTDEMPSKAQEEGPVSEAELDSLVQQSLGEHYSPIEDADASEATHPRKKEEAPDTDQEEGGDESEEEESDEGSEKESKKTETPKKSEKEHEEGKNDTGSNPESERDMQPRVTETKPSGLDRRLAKVWIEHQMLLGTDADELPSIDALAAEMHKYSIKERKDAMHFHRLEVKKLRGQSGNALDQEDLAAIREAEREEVRQEVLAEINEKRERDDFVAFIGDHPELDEESKEYDQTLSSAVETLWRNGMPIRQAFATVTESIEKTRGDAKREEARRKQRSLSGVASSSGDGGSDSSEDLTYEDMAKLQAEDPTEWERLIRSGYTPKR